MNTALGWDQLAKEYEAIKSGKYHVPMGLAGMAKFTLDPSLKPLAPETVEPKPLAPPKKKKVKNKKVEKAPQMFEGKTIAQWAEETGLSKWGVIWRIRKGQPLKKRKNPARLFDGKTAKQWAEELGISVCQVYWRFKTKGSVKAKIQTEPKPKPKGRKPKEPTTNNPLIRLAQKNGVSYRTAHPELPVVCPRKK